MSRKQFPPKQLYFLCALGVCIVLLGVVVQITGWRLPLVPKPGNLPLILYNAGALAAFGAIAQLDTQKRRAKNPEAVKREEIEAADERNQALHNRAYAGAFRVLSGIMGVAVPLLALFGFMDKVAFMLLVLALAGAWLYGGYIRQRLEQTA